MLVLIQACPIVASSPASSLQSICRSDCAAGLPLRYVSTVRHRETAGVSLLWAIRRRSALAPVGALALPQSRPAADAQPPNARRIPPHLIGAVRPPSFRPGRADAGNNRVLRSASSRAADDIQVATHDDACRTGVAADQATTYGITNIGLARTDHLVKRSAVWLDRSGNPATRHATMHRIHGSFGAGCRLRAFSRFRRWGWPCPSNQVAYRPVRRQIGGQNASVRPLHQIRFGVSAKYGARRRASPTACGQVGEITQACAPLRQTSSAVPATHSSGTRRAGDFFRARRR